MLQPGAIVELRPGGPQDLFTFFASYRRKRGIVMADRYWRGCAVVLWPHLEVEEAAEWWHPSYLCQVDQMSEKDFWLLTHVFRESTKSAIFAPAYA